jgi:S-adenosylmethionine:tRNA ribosyltransferase-isomerase
VYNKGDIIDSQFYQIKNHLPEDSFLVFNNTKVFPARLLFRKSTGAEIEIFCISPIPSTNSDSTARWECMVGNAKKWKNEEVLVLVNGVFSLEAKLISRQKDLFEVEFSWNTQDTFFDIAEYFATLPLPPYLNRKATENDKTTYQTVYAKEKGSVAAPTAGLHFTDRILESLPNKDFITLHVGAGTFKPVKVDNVFEHDMHKEHFSVSVEFIEKLSKQKVVIPVGTTSMRVLESLYHLACKWISGVESLHIEQRDGFNNIEDKPYQDILQLWLTMLKAKNITQVNGSTQIFILPGYKLRICRGLITNFHQPKSTLLLLVATLIGNDWKRVYEHALANDYRFLSYGDSSLLLP